MSNQLRAAKDVTPKDAVGNPAPALTALFDGWVSEPFSVEGTEHGSIQVNFLGDLDFDGATSMEILPEHAPPSAQAGGAPAVWYPAMRLNASGIAVPAIAIMDPAQLALVGSSPFRFDLSWAVEGFSWIRFRARAIAGAAPTLSAQLTSGGSGSN